MTGIPEKILAIHAALDAADLPHAFGGALALPGHRATKNFFEGQHFTARALVMHRRLGPAGS